MENIRSVKRVSESTFYVVGGLPLTGKTTVSDRLVHELRICSMETDHIRVLFNTTPSSSLRVDAHVGIGKTTRKMLPRLECLIEVMVEKGQDYIINGECIEPEMVSESPYLDQINSCFMGLNDADSTFSRIRDLSDPRDWTMSKPDEELRDILGKYAERRRILGGRCVEFGLPYVDASVDFLSAQEEVYYALRDEN